MCWSQRGLSSSNWAGSPRNPRRNPQQCRCQPWCVGCSKDPTKVIHKNKSTVHFRKQGIKDSKQQGSHPAPIQLSTGYAISTHFVDPPLLVNLCDLVLPTGSENLDSPVGLGYICFQKQESRVFVGPVPHTPFWHPTPASWVEGTDSSRQDCISSGSLCGLQRSPSQHWMARSEEMDVAFGTNCPSLHWSNFTRVWPTVGYHALNALVAHQTGTTSCWWRGAALQWVPGMFQEGSNWQRTILFHQRQEHLAKDEQAITIYLFLLQCGKSGKSPH